SSAGPLIFNGISNRSRNQIALGLDLAIPPLSALVLLAFATFLVCLMLKLLGLSAAPFYAASADGAILLLAIALAWANHGQDVLPIGFLPKIAPYLMSQLRIYQR